MKVCIIPGNNPDLLDIENIAISLQNQNNIVSIGYSNIDNQFKGSGHNDLTNLVEYSFEGKVPQNNYNSDIFMFLDNDWNSVKSVSRILRSTEYKLLKPRKIFLYGVERWAKFYKMLDNTFIDFEQQNILKIIELSDKIELGNFQLNKNT